MILVSDHGPGSGGNDPGGLIGQQRGVGMFEETDTAEPALDHRIVPLIPVGEPQRNGSARSAALFVESTPSARRNVQRCSSVSSSSRHVAVDWAQVHSALRRRS